MAQFYEEMAAMSRDLLAPTSRGGLGQGVIAIIHRTQVDPVNEWDTPWYTTTTEILDGAVSGVSQKMISSGELGQGGPVILATDLQAVCTPPKTPFATGDILTIDGKHMTVISYDNIPPAGVAVVTKFILRG